MLDSKDSVRAADRTNMLSAVGSLPKDLSDGLRRGRTSGLPRFSPSEVVFCGVGGSAISGDMLREWLASSCPVPVTVVRDYSLPAHVNKNSMVVVCSYSGNTEEALSMFEEARRRRSKVLAITSGGQLAKICEANSCPLVRMPSGMMPRAAIGHVFGAMLGALERSGIVSADKQAEEAVRVMTRVSSFCSESVPAPDNPAKVLAHELFSHLPVVVGYGISRPLAKRWADQMCENAKSMAFSLDIPELDHNAIAGVMGDQRSRNLAFVFLEHTCASARMKKRVVATREMISKVSPVYTTEAMGLSPLAQMFSVMMVGDYVSIYLAILRGQDPSTNDAIDELKAVLSKK